MNQNIEFRNIEIIVKRLGGKHCIKYKNQYELIMGYDNRKWILLNIDNVKIKK